MAKQYYNIAHLVLNNNHTLTIIIIIIINILCMVVGFTTTCAISAYHH